MRRIWILIIPVVVLILLMIFNEPQRERSTLDYSAPIKAGSNMAGGNSGTQSIDNKLPDYPIGAEEHTEYKGDKGLLRDEKINSGTKENRETAQNIEPSKADSKSTHSGHEKKFFLTHDEIIAMNNVSFTDKIMGLSILRKLNKSDIEDMLKIARGGITFDEMEDLKKILLTKLEPDEIEKLEGMLRKNKKLYAQGRL
ncbi:MAG: hypothetical protein ACOYWZ_18475 [Bacillota bacterium]